MKLNRDEFLKTLEVAKMAVAGSDQIEQLGHFIFTNDNLITFNNRLCIYYPFKSDVECSVRSNLFHKQLGKFETEDINVTLSKKTLTLKGTREKATLSVTLEKDDEIFGILKTIRAGQKDSDYKEIPEQFTKAVDFCSYSASKDAADGTLCCICIRDSKIFSTDNFRATVFELGEDMGNQMLLDATLAKEIKRFKMTSYARDENWIHFKNDDNVVLSARQIFGDYPNIEKAFEFKGQRMKLPKKLIDALDFVSVLTNEDAYLDRVARVNINAGYVTATVERAGGTSEKSIKLDDKYKDLNINFQVQVEFLYSILEHTTTMIYNIELQRAMFKSGPFKHIIRIMSKKKED